jgi:hypothetical protein
VAQAQRSSISSREAFVTSEQSVAQIDLDLAMARQAVMRATVACGRAIGGSTGRNNVAER